MLSFPGNVDALDGAKECKCNEYFRAVHAIRCSVSACRDLCPSCRKVLHSLATLSCESWCLASRLTGVRVERQILCHSLPSHPHLTLARNPCSWLSSPYTKAQGATMKCCPLNHHPHLQATFSTCTHTQTHKTLTYNRNEVPTLRTPRSRTRLSSGKRLHKPQHAPPFVAAPTCSVSSCDHISHSLHMPREHHHPKDEVRSLFCHMFMQQQHQRWRRQDIRPA